MSAKKRLDFSMLTAAAVPQSAAVPAAQSLPPPETPPEPQAQLVVRQATPIAQSAPRAARRRESAFRPQSRVGKRALTVWLDPAAKRQFDQICLNEDKKGEELLREFLNDSFDKRGFSRIA